MAKQKNALVAPQASKELRSTDLAEYPEASTQKDKDVDNSAALASHERRQHFATTADAIAHHTFYYRNYKFHESMKEYPLLVDVDQRIVTKCYPQAEGGMLLVDEPRSELEMKKAFEKQKVLKKLGYRHVVIVPNKSAGEIASEQLTDGQ